ITCTPSWRRRCTPAAPARETVAQSTATRCSGWRSRRAAPASDPGLGARLAGCTRPARRPPPRPIAEWSERRAEARAVVGEIVATTRPQGDDPGRAQLAQPLVQDARRHRVAAGAQVGEDARAVPQLPHDAERPAPSEEIEERHHRPPGARPADRA